VDEVEVDVVEPQPLERGGEGAPGVLVDATNEFAPFLTSRRSKVTPQQAKLRRYGRRQAPGLRREEVASLAGVSVEYYRRLERGSAAGVSDSVLDALADALQLDDAERGHLFDLARAAGPVAPRRRRRASPQAVRPVVQRIVDSIGSPAAVMNMRSDYLAANALGRALYARCSTAVSSLRTRRASPSSTPRPSTSSPTGSEPPRTSSPPCVQRRAATRTTAR